MTFKTRYFRLFSAAVVFNRTAVATSVYISKMQFWIFSMNLGTLDNVPSRGNKETNGSRLL